MVFTTLTFIIFMGITFTLYYIVPQKYQWKTLLLASYVFYAWTSPLYLIFLLITTIVTYFGTVFIEKNREKSKLYLIIVICILLGMLIGFKYTNFFLRNVKNFSVLFGRTLEIPSLRIILPIGLSFYTFQSLGYCIDVYREMVDCEKDFLKHALYVSYFPQLLQGPIGNYSKLSPQLFSPHTFSYKEAVFGLQRASWGFFKKMVIANQISLAIDGTWTNYSDYQGLFVWIFILCLYSIQLYADFSGYMDIAIGCSQMLGITLDENFDTPYFSKNIAEFWRRWNITLGTWFKNYVFYPLLRSENLSKIRKHWRKSNPYLSNTVPTVIALLIVWLLIGFWHGADWSYVAYGLFHGGFIILSTLMAPVYSKFHSKYPKLQTSKLYSLFQIIRTFAIVTFGYVIFRPANLHVTTGIVNLMGEGIGLFNLLHFVTVYLKELSAAFLGTVVLFCVDLYHFNLDSILLREKISNFSILGRWIIYVIFVCAILILGVYGRSDLDQFAYFRF